MAEQTKKVYGKENIFKRFGRGFVNFFAKSIPQFFTKKIPGFFKGFFGGIGRWFRAFGERFKTGSVGTKVSHFICGFGSFYHGQIIKGIILLGLQVLFILYMVLCPAITGPNGIQVPSGYKSLINLGLGGHDASFTPTPGSSGWTPDGEFIPADSSFLMLLLGLVTIAVIILYIIIWLGNIKSSYAADTAVKEGRKPSTFVEDLKALGDNRFHVLMLTPTCLAALIFTLLPTILMICIAFTSYNINAMAAAEPPTELFHWVGFSNFADVFNPEATSSLGIEIGARFLPVLGWTFAWAILATFSCYFGGILLAVLINKKGLKFKKVFRTIFILTIAIPQFVSLLIMRNLLMAGGPVNSIIQKLGWANQDIGFLGMDKNDNPWVARVVVVIINMWLGIPYTMLMTSGILMNIPADLYEAAKVDGTSRPKMFFKITLPYVIFITTPYLIGSFVGNINSFNTIFLLTGGGPAVIGDGATYTAGQTDLLVTWLYKLTIDQGDYNTGAVIGIFTFIITATITLITYRRSKAYNEEDTFQ